MGPTWHYKPGRVCCCQKGAGCHHEDSVKSQQKTEQSCYKGVASQAWSSLNLLHPGAPRLSGLLRLPALQG